MCIWFHCRKIYLSGTFFKSTMARYRNIVNKNYMRDCILKEIEAFFGPTSLRAFIDEILEVWLISVTKKAIELSIKMEYLLLLKKSLTGEIWFKMLFLRMINFIWMQIWDLDSNFAFDRSHCLSSSMNMKGSKISSICQNLFFMHFDN